MSELPAILANLPSLSGDDLEAYEHELAEIRRSVKMEERSAWDA